MTPRMLLDVVVDTVSDLWQVAPREVLSDARRPAVVVARTACVLVADIACEQLSLKISQRAVAAHLRRHPSSIADAHARGEHLYRTSTVFSRLVDESVERTITQLR